MRYELVAEIHRDDEGEAVSIAHELAREHAVTVTVYAVESGRTFAEDDKRVIVATIEP